jgi:hypothetical protein
MLFSFYSNVCKILFFLMSWKEWRKDHPPGFSAKYANQEGGLGHDPMKWICKIPGKTGVSYFFTYAVN